MMIGNLRRRGVMLRCHAFASSAKIQQTHYSRCKSVSAMQLGPSSRVNKYYPWIYQRGGNQSSSRNHSLHSTASTLKESSNSVGENGEIEKRARESLSIASGGTAPTELKSFGGLTYRESSPSKSPSLFRVVFILGGPGKT